MVCYTWLASCCYWNDFHWSLEGETIKCIVCDNAEGEHDWWLSPVDFELKGVKNQTKYSLKNCFCEYCYADANRDKGLDHYLFNYWLSIQPIEMKEEVMECFYCGKNAGSLSWWYQDQEETKVEKCLCSVCNLNIDVTESKLDTKFFETFLKEIKPKEINTPNYYTWHPKVSCKEVSQEFMSNLGQAIQYIWRSNTLKTTKGQTKAEVIADLNKAIDFIKFEIERLENSE